MSSHPQQQQRQEKVGIVFRLSILFLGGFFLSSCGMIYEETAIRSWKLMREGRQAEALSIYEMRVKGKNEALLKLLDQGIILRTAGEFKASNEKFFAAAKIIENNGYIDIREQAITLVTNEKQTFYQGEDFEKVLVHLYLGLNFLALGEVDDALVETRRVNEILFRMISQGNRPYEQNAFAKYLGGMLFENDGNENDALVSYRSVLKIQPNLETQLKPLQMDILRVTKRGGFDQEFDFYKKTFGDEAAENAIKSLKEKRGSVVLLAETGMSPQKYSSKEKRMTTGKGGTALEVMIPVAYYKNRKTLIRKVELSAGGEDSKSMIVNDIERTAVQHLKDRMGRAIAKALLTAGMKAGIATGIGVATNSKEIGVLAGLALFLASEADTRSWLLLPAELQVAKVFLKPGKYNVKINYLGLAGETYRTEIIPDVPVKAGKATFIQRRALD